MAKRPDLPMPEDMQQALEAASLLNAFALRPDNQRNGYVSWIQESRREITRRKRIRQMLEELYAGDVYRGAAWGTSCARPKKH
ncbi:MAG: YdeI/OmpD-associated family protein [Coriobacteriia bacterium]|nr:YdeI/OmpD-associated family protein [Coriobacteriia bacterium]